MELNPQYIIAGLMLAGFLFFVMKSRGNRIPVAVAKQKVQEGATLLDVRTTGEFKSGHVDGAVNIPVQVLKDRLAEIDKDQEVVVYCASGMRSRAAKSVLEKSGFVVSDLGPMPNW